MPFNVVVWRQRFEDYVNDAAFLADWEDTTVQAGAVSYTWDLDGTHTTDGTGVAAHLHVQGNVTEGDIFSVTKVVGTADGVAASTAYSFRRQAWANAVIAGLPANQFNQISTAASTDASGNVSLTLRLVVVSGGMIDWEIWFDDVHLTQALDGDFLLNAGVVEVNGTVLGYTRDGVEMDEADEWETLDFPGRKADVTEADLKRVSRMRYSMTVVSVPKVLEEAFPGITTSTGTGLVNTIYTPHPAGTVLGSGDYLTDLTVHWPYGPGFLRGRLLKAVAKEPRLISRDKDEVTIRLTFEARVDRATYLADSTTSPWLFEFLDAVS